MIVADTNLIAYLVFAGDRTATTRAVWIKDSDWWAPTFWRSEFRNALALYVRRGHYTIDEAPALMKAAEDMPRGREHPVASEPVPRLAERCGCTAYDCEFVHVAQSLGVPLVTSDKKLLQAFPQVAVAMEEFAASTPPSGGPT